MKASGTGYMLVATGSLLSASGLILTAVLVHEGLSAFEIATLPYAASVVMLLPAILRSRKERQVPHYLRNCLILSLLCATSTLAQVGSVSFGTPVALVSVLMYTEPLWLSLLSWLVFSRPIRKFDWIVIAIATVGIVIALQNTGKFQSPVTLGGVLAVLGSFLCALWTLWGAEIVRTGKSAFGTMGIANFFMVIEVLATAVFLNHLSVTAANTTQFHIPYNTKIWSIILVQGLFAQVLANPLFLTGASMINSTAVGLLVLIEPVAVIVASTWLAGNRLGNSFWIGATLIICSYLLGLGPSERWGRRVRSYLLTALGRLQRA